MLQQVSSSSSVQRNGDCIGMRHDLRREEELAEAAVEERDASLEYVSFTIMYLKELDRCTPKIRRLRTMVVFSGEVASS